MNSDRLKNSPLYCEKLLGLKNDCHLPYCRDWERSTGWLLYHVELDGWFVEFECPSHGRGGTWRPEWQSLIDEVLKIKAREGIDIGVTVQTLPDESERKTDDRIVSGGMNGRSEG